MIYEHAVDPPHALPADDPQAIVRDFTQRCTDVLEMYVRRYPDLWLWMHRRWRDLEPAAASIPGMFPAAGDEEGGSVDEADGRP
jgi:lauroyl/myristoyl acyltransferase